MTHMDERTALRPPRTVIAAVSVAVLIALLILVETALIGAHAGRDADNFLRSHPDSNRTLRLIGSYLAVVVLCGLSLTMVIAARALSAGKRWSWIILIALSVLGILNGIFQAHSALERIENLPNLALLICLLLPATRSFVRRDRDQLPV